MNKVVLASLALILVRDCDIGGPRFHGQIKGTWGGENAGLMAFDTTAHVHIGCTAGDTKQAIVTDAQDRKSTRLNSSHDQISYAVFCLKKKKKFEDFIDPKNPTPLPDRQQYLAASHDLPSMFMLRRIKQAPVTPIRPQPEYVHLEQAYN